MKTLHYLILVVGIIAACATYYYLDDLREDLEFESDIKALRSESTRNTAAAYNQYQKPVS